MNEVWNLDRIYNPFDDPAFASDMEQLKHLAKAFEAFPRDIGNIAPIDGLRQGIDYLEKLTVLLNKLACTQNTRRKAPPSCLSTRRCCV